MKLSICIPVYNNEKLFRYSLESALNAIRGYEKKAEIVVSDNCSEEDIESIVYEACIKNPKIKIIYSRNEINRGLAYNFHKVVELANGEFCWIIGSDDFLYENAIKEVLRVIGKNPNLSFISASYAHLNLPSVVDENNIEDPYKNILNIIKEGSSLTFEKGPIESGEVNWDGLVDPSFNNVMLGAVMAGIFKKSKWNSVNRDKMDKSAEFTNLQNVYPHIYIYANSMVGEPSYYIDEPLLVVGDGARPWAGDKFSDGSLPIIFLKIFNEIIDAYSVGGLNKKQLQRCKLAVAHTAGRYLFPFLNQKIIKKKNIKNEEHIKISRIIINNWTLPTFYLGIIKGVVKVLIRKDS